MSNPGPVEPQVVAQMNAFAEVLRDILPEEFGFTLLIFKAGDVKGGRMNYLSTAERDVMITAMKEFIANVEGRAFAPPKSKQ